MEEKVEFRNRDNGWCIIICIDERDNLSYVYLPLIEINKKLWKVLSPDECVAEFCMKWNAFCFFFLADHLIENQFFIICNNVYEIKDVFMII